MRSMPYETMQGYPLIVRDGVQISLEDLRGPTPDSTPSWLPPTARVAMEQVQHGLDKLAALNPADLPPELGLEVAAALLTVQDRVQALALRAVADVHTRDLHLLDALPSTGTWVGEQRRSMPRSHVALARKLDRLPQVAERIAAGGLSVEGGARIGQALDRLRPHTDRPDGLIDGQPAEQALSGVVVDGVSQLIGEAYGGLADADPRVMAIRERLVAIVSAPLAEITRLESAFLVLAEHVPPGLLSKALAVLVDALLPNQLEHRSQDAHARRSLELIRTPDGSGWLLRGTLDDECGERLHTALAATLVTDPENLEDTAARQVESPDPEVDPAPRRSKTQRRHDALNLLLAKILSAGQLGSRGKVPVQIGVTVSLDALHEAPGALPARTSSGATIPISLVRRWWCDSAISRFVLGLGGRVIETSHTARTLKPHERRIKQLETGGICQAAGCCRGDPTRDPLIPHHATPWKTTGTTSIDDTVLLCPISHDDLHVGGKTLRLKDGRRLDQDGWVALPG